MSIARQRITSTMWLTIGILAASAGVLTISSQAGEPAAFGLDKEGKERLTVAEFERLHKKLRKMSTERVWSIPWQLSVRKARELAAKEKKPVFLWISSNGGTHPLGPC